jgi:hypothetical protein
MDKAAPPRWTAEELELGRQGALAEFISSWGAEGTQRYVDTVAQLSVPLARLFTASNDLSDLSAETFTGDASLIAAARFVAAPPVSADDLKTLIGGNLGARSPDAERAARAAKIVRTAWDPLRFPWLAQRRPATDIERETAIKWTASIWAIESMRTYQRNASARKQELKVAEAVKAAGFQPLAPRRIDALEQLAKGSFTRECRIGDHKSDVPVRLHDGRLLAIECKVSNSAVNSKKRLNNDVGAKAADWKKTFGAQVITAVVLSGVYSLGNLIAAQEHQDITIFWAHDLGRLTEFATAAI